MTYSDEERSVVLDHLITACQNGQAHPHVPSLALEEAALAERLLTIAENIQPYEFPPSLWSSVLSDRGGQPIDVGPSVRRNGRHLPPQSANPRWLAVPAFVVAVLLLAVLAIPGARALAQDVILLFQRSDSDTLVIHLAPTPRGLAPQPTDMFTASEGPLALDSNYPLTLDQASAEAGFRVQTPATIPQGFEFRGARYNSNGPAVEQYFVFSEHIGPTLTPQFTFIQQPVSFTDPIGPSATVELVNVGEFLGEYVSGGWLYKPTGTQVEPDGSLKQEFTWERTMVPLQTLRWAQNGHFFEIAYVASDTQEGHLLMQDLIDLAASVR